MRIQFLIIDDSSSNLHSLMEPSPSASILLFRQGTALFKNPLFDGETILKIWNLNKVTESASWFSTNIVSFWDLLFARFHVSSNTCMYHKQYIRVLCIWHIMYHISLILLIRDIKYLHLKYYIGFLGIQHLICSINLVSMFTDIFDIADMIRYYKPSFDTDKLLDFKP